MLTAKIVVVLLKRFQLLVTFSGGGAGENQCSDDGPHRQWENPIGKNTCKIGRCSVGGYRRHHSDTGVQCRV